MSRWYYGERLRHIYLLIRYETNVDDFCNEECRVLCSYDSKWEADAARDLNNLEARRQKSPYTYCSIKVKCKEFY